jgi:inactive STAND
MSSDQRLEQKRQGLQQQYDLVAEKLNRLRLDHAIATDTLVRFEREKQIEQTEGELKELEQQLYYLEQSVSSERLYQALLRLGYRQQTREFRKFIEVYSTAAFLIHGSPDYGQRWLLNRLVVQHVPNIITGKIVRIDLSRIARRSDINALWRELGGRVDLGRQSTIPEIADRVYQLWQTQNVLLIFYNVNCLQEAFLNELIQGFWLPLATKAKEATLRASQFKLLMFLVDYDGCSGSWNVPFAENQNSWKLTEITEFSEDELTNWLEYEADTLPTKLIDQIDQTIQIILKNSDNGIPEPTLGEICRLSDCNWYEQEEKWLRL